MAQQTHTRDIDLDSIQSDGFDIQHVLESARYFLLHQMTYERDGKRDRTLEQISSLVSVSLDRVERLNRDLESCYQTIEVRDAENSTPTVHPYDQSHRAKLHDGNSHSSDEAPSTLPSVQSYSIEMEELRKLTIQELHAFREAVNVLYKIASGFTFKPRFINEEKHRFDNLNGAGVLLQKITDQLLRYESDAVGVAEMAEPSTPEDMEWRNWLLLTFKADIMASELSEFAEFAGECEKGFAAAKAAAK